MAHCPTCHTEYADDLAECPACGTADDTVYQCARCGEKYRGSDACLSCGNLREPVPCEEHPERSAVARCVVCGRALCEACVASDRRAALCNDHADVRVIEGWAQVYSAKTEFEAQLLRENLRAEGIDAQIFSQRDLMFSVDLGELSIIRVLVPAWEYERALAVIQAHMDTDGEVVFACPVCGEAFEPGAQECVSCGSPLT